MNPLWFHFLVEVSNCLSVHIVTLSANLEFTRCFLLKENHICPDTSGSMAKIGQGRVLSGLAPCLTRPWRTNLPFSRQEPEAEHHLDLALHAAFRSLSAPKKGGLVGNDFGGGGGGLGMMDAAPCFLVALCVFVWRFGI